MPIGSFAAVPHLAQALIETRPSSILDLGMGFGGNGVAVREWLDLGIRPWKTYLAGVEAWANYRNPVWDLYNVVHVQTIEGFLTTSRESFDCVIFGDVLEHFEKPAGRAIIERIKTRVAVDGSLLVATPAQFFAQGAVYGNELERHRSFWSDADLEQLGFRVERCGRREFACGECWFGKWRK